MPRAVIRAGVDGVTEDDFYRLQNTGHQDYSVRSAASDGAVHDRQHLDQIREILASG